MVGAKERKANMEAKVNFHVRKYLRECDEKGMKPSDSTVTQHLLSTYGEYARKPQVMSCMFKDSVVMLRNKF